MATAWVFAAVGDLGMLPASTRVDDTWLRLMISGGASLFTAVANVVNVLGRVRHVSARMAIADLLALQRRWWHLAAPRPPLLCSRAQARA